MVKDSEGVLFQDTTVDTERSGLQSATVARTPVRGRHTILFLAASPYTGRELSLHQDAKAIQEELERAGYRDAFEIVTRWAVTPLDVLRELRRFKPTLVHFCGFAKASLATGSIGDRDRHGFVFDGAKGPQLVQPQAFKELFVAAGASVKLIVLSRCYSEWYAESFVACVPCVVGTLGRISDPAARDFVIGLYGGLAEGEAVGAAFAQGRVAIALSADAVDVDNAVLLAASGVDADNLRVVSRPKTRCLLTIKATLADFDAVVIARVRAQLRLLSGDVLLEIVEMQEGSVRLVISTSPGAAAKLAELSARGGLATVEGFEVSSFDIDGMPDSHLLVGQAMTPDGDGGGTTEIAHESPSRGAPPQRSWLGESKDDAQPADQSWVAAHQWQQKGFDPRLLSPGNAVAEAKRFLLRHGGPLSEVERGFLEAVFSFEAAQARRRRSVVISSLAALSSIAVAMMVFLVIIQRSRAEVQQDLTVSEAKNQEAERKLEIAQTKERLRLAAEAVAVKSTGETKVANDKLGESEEQLRIANEELVKALAEETESKNKAVREKKRAEINEARATKAEAEALAAEAIAVKAKDELNKAYDKEHDRAERLTKQLGSTPVETLKP